MKLGVLFSGGKDSTYSAWLAKEFGYELTCLISIFSKNPESYMFHTPSIEQVKKQAQTMEIPLIIQKTKGEKEEELKDLEKAIQKAIKKYKINPAGEGGEFETFVLNCPLFKKELSIINKSQRDHPKGRKISSNGENSWKMELEVE